MPKLPALLPLLLALLAAGCKSEAGASTGASLYKKWGCATCHGSQGDGGSLGPALKDMGRYWDRAGMAAFLADPRAGLGEDERLRALDEAYRTNMPPFAQLTPDELEKLAEFVLALE